MHRRLKIFFDSSVLVSATISSKGMSRYLIDLVVEGKIIGIISSNVFFETEAVLKRKMPEVLSLFYKIIEMSNFQMIGMPSGILVDKFEKLVEYRPDASIIASAFEAKADVLVSLDRKHLVGNKKVWKEIGLKVKLPKDIFSRS